VTRNYKVQFFIAPAMIKDVKTSKLELTRELLYFKVTQGGTYWDRVTGQKVTLKPGEMYVVTYTRKSDETFVAFNDAKASRYTISFLSVNALLDVQAREHRKEGIPDPGFELIPDEQAFFESGRIAGGNYYKPKFVNPKAAVIFQLKDGIWMHPVYLTSDTDTSDPYYFLPAYPGEALILQTPVKAQQEEADAQASGPAMLIKVMDPKTNTLIRIEKVEAGRLNRKEFGGGAHGIRLFKEVRGNYSNSALNYGPLTMVKVMPDGLGSSSTSPTACSV